MSQADLERALQPEQGASILAYVTAGYPDRAGFLRALDALDRSADAIEIGIPFSDPMADGSTIQRSSKIALENGATLDRTLRDLEARPAARPRVLMSYLNPLLALPHDALAPRLAAARIDGLVVPDLPYDEATALRDALAAVGIALVPMITPLTAPDRMREIAAHARGFVYAVTSTGTTGQSVESNDALTRYLAHVREVASVPVIAGFGVRNKEHVAALCPPAHGVVVGSALVEVLERGEALDAFVDALRTEAQTNTRASVHLR